MRNLFLIACLVVISPTAWCSDPSDYLTPQKQAEAGATLVVKNFMAAEGKFEQLGTWFGEILADTRAFKGCIKVDVFSDESSKTYTLIEEWDTMASYESYMEWRTQGGGVDMRGRDLIGGATTYKWGTKMEL